MRLGLATAKQFVEEGAYVYITGRRQQELDAAVTSISSNITAIQGDVTKRADLDRIYPQIGKDKGRLDIVFANAGPPRSSWLRHGRALRKRV